jgi:hypothetical protein
MPITVRRLAVLAILLVTAFAMGAAVSSHAEAPAPVVRVALLPQWVIQQHRSLPALAEAIEGGVVDRTVFAWQRGVIQRQALVSKPIRVVPDPAPLGGRGRFDLTVRPSTGRAAWTEIEVHQSSPSADDVLLLEIGGERNTITQVLETLLIAEPGRPLAEIPLARPALVAGAGVPVVASTFDAPLAPAMAQRFRQEAGLDLLVVRPPLWDVRNGDQTSSGRADTVPFGGGDWREGDRVFLRIPVSKLGQGVPGIVLGWKDRTLQNDPNAEFPRRSSLPLPVIR